MTNDDNEETPENPLASESSMFSDEWCSDLRELIAFLHDYPHYTKIFIDWGRSVRLLHEKDEK